MSGLLSLSQTIYSYREQGKMWWPTATKRALRQLFGEQSTAYLAKALAETLRQLWGIDNEHYSTSGFRYIYTANCLGSKASPFPSNQCSINCKKCHLWPETIWQMNAKSFVGYLIRLSYTYMAWSRNDKCGWCKLALYHNFKSGKTLNKHLSAHKLAVSGYKHYAELLSLLVH